MRVRSASWLPVTAPWVVSLLRPEVASAHLVSTGLGPFFDGVTHLLVSPDDLLGVIALSLLAGLNSKRHGRQLLFLLPTAWIVGGLFGLRETSELLAPVASALSFLAIGVLVATDIRLRPLVLFGLTCLFGLLHGYLNGTVAGQEGLGFTGVIGVAVAVFVLVALLASFVVSLRAYWTRVAVRVAGSWIAAIGLLMVGWTLRSSS